MIIETERLFLLSPDSVDVNKVKEYLTRLRLWHTEEELISTNYPVIDIALNNSFPNIKSISVSIL